MYKNKRLHFHHLKHLQKNANLASSNAVCNIASFVMAVLGTGIPLLSTSVVLTESFLDNLLILLQTASDIPVAIESLTTRNALPLTLS